MTYTLGGKVTPVPGLLLRASIATGSSHRRSAN
jgi:hypothetical protein